MCLEPARALDHAAAHIYLTDLGHQNAHVDRLLTEILQAEEIGGAECLPNHDLERQWLKGIWSGGEDEATNVAGLLARTCMARRLDALRCAAPDLYAFTHVVLYATDMGRRPVQWPRGVADIVADAEAGLAVAVDADNFDLAAELLWTWPMLGLTWSPAASFCFKILTAVQDYHGFLPGPDYSAQDVAGLSQERQDEYVLRTSYHATLVMGLLCAVLRYDLGAPVPSAAAPASTGAIDLILPLLQSRSRDSQWESFFSQLDATDRESLAGFVLTVALRRAAASDDLGTVRLSLRIALDSGVIDPPAVHQGLALLCRSTLLGQIRGFNASTLG
jgi:hypothetical protein